MLQSEGREARAIKTKEVGLVIRPNDVFMIESGGGGGWGEPSTRSAQTRTEDRICGFVTEA